MPRPCPSGIIRRVNAPNRTVQAPTLLILAAVLSFVLARTNIARPGTPAQVSPSDTSGAPDLDAAPAPVTSTSDPDADRTPALA